MKRGLILVFLTAVISGFAIFMNKFSVNGVNPYTFTFLKNVVVAVALFSLIILFKNFNEIKNLRKKDWGKLVLIGFVGGSIPFLLFYKGLSLTSGVMGAFIHKTMFIFVGVLAVVFLREKLNKWVFVSALALLLGNYLLLKVKFVSFNVGDLMILGATLFWAGENVISKHVLKKLSGNVVAFGRMFFGSVFILIFLLFSGKLVGLGELGASQIGWVLFTSLLLLGYVTTWYNGIKHVKISIATSILLIGSPITTLLSFGTGAVMSLIQFTGILLILVGVASIFYLEKVKSSQPHIHSV